MTTDGTRNDIRLLIQAISQAARKAVEDKCTGSSVPQPFRLIILYSGSQDLVRIDQVLAHVPELRANHPDLEKVIEVSRAVQGALRDTEIPDSNVIRLVDALTSFAGHEDWSLGDGGFGEFTINLDSSVVEHFTHSTKVMQVKTDEVDGRRLELLNASAPNPSQGPAQNGGAGPAIPAWAVSDGGERVDFDARPWFELATPDAIRELMESDWKHGDNVASFCAPYFPEINEIFHWVNQAHASGDPRLMDASFYCHVDGEKAEEWLLARRPECLESFQPR